MIAENQPLHCMLLMLCTTHWEVFHFIVFFFFKLYFDHISCRMVIKITLCSFLEKKRWLLIAEEVQVEQGNLLNDTLGSSKVLCFCSFGGKKTKITAICKTLQK